MRFKHRAWIPVAWLLSLLNVGAVWFAARPGEPLHATVHALLALLFGLAAQRLASRTTLTNDSDVAERLQDLEGGLADLDKLQGVEGRIAELEERLDFTERALVNVKARTQLPPKE